MTSGGHDVHDAYLAWRYFGELGGLGALAIAMVVQSHSSVGPCRFGWGIGVELLFTTGGFLITTLLLRERARTGTISLHEFHVRRVLQVLVWSAERDATVRAEFFLNLPAYVTFTAKVRFGRPWWFPVVLMVAMTGVAYLAAYLLRRPEGFRAARHVVDRAWSAPLALAFILNVARRIVPGGSRLATFERPIMNLRRYLIRTGPDAGRAPTPLPP